MTCKKLIVYATEVYGQTVYNNPDSYSKRLEQVPHLIDFRTGLKLPNQKCLLFRNKVLPVGCSRTR
jgi:hypothetical protein